MQSKLSKFIDKPTCDVQCSPIIVTTNIWWIGWLNEGGWMEARMHFKRCKISLRVARQDLMNVALFDGAQ
eukprot:scaffold127306_cov30-Prasinocladus_malaysianus.AAC.1